MPIAFAILDALWNTFAGALFGGLIASGIVAYITQKIIERRERRSRRDQLRLELYLDVIDLLLDNEVALAERGSEGQIAPIELQTKRLRIAHRLKLLGSKEVETAYDSYRKLVFEETAHPIEQRPQDPHAVILARDRVIRSMQVEIQHV